MHPDRDDTVNIYLKTWLTEDEYKDAKAHGLLLHQNSRKDLKLEIKTPSDEPEVSMLLSFAGTIMTLYNISFPPPRRPANIFYGMRHLQGITPPNRIHSVRLVLQLVLQLRKSHAAWAPQRHRICSCLHPERRLGVLPSLLV